MYTEKLYHGSNRTRGEEIIEIQELKVTRGDKHWLGDGSYLFVEDFQAYKWILDMFKSRYSGQDSNYDNIINNYLVLECKVETNKTRIFDLTKSEHKILFDRVRKEMVEMKKIKTKEMAEGVTLNYMFNVLGFDKDFDFVRAIFCLNRGNYTDFQSHLAYLPQEQICIKNEKDVKDIVKNINEYDFKNKIETFESLLTEYYYVSPKMEVPKRGARKKGQYVNSKSKGSYKRRQLN